MELLTWVTVLSGLFHLVISVASLLLVLLIARGGLPVTALALPLVLSAFLPFLLGVGWFLSALGVFVRDVGQMMNMIVSLTMFMSPVFYSVSTLNVRWQFNKFRNKFKGKFYGFITVLFSLNFNMFKCFGR